ncbi:Hypothetical protein DHA2_5012 [Giardia duodenalis]|uniref:Rhodanese domain-containing protein n=1 Tax=Giardia intestinalis TaxID=5741 RepID=V6TGM9_GIAIN|nr:Hypothetical protein DHA2_5012 [Giardia intestinalis]
MSLRAGASTKSKVDPLDKKLPANPKYANVTSTINSGPTIDKFYAKHGQEATNARFKRNTSQKYKRIRLATLQKWIETAMTVLAQPDFLDSGESIYSLDDGNGPIQRPGSVCSAITSVSMADTEASVCGDEPGVPPMFMGGPDIKELLNRLNTCRPTTSEANGAYIRDTTAMPVVTDYVRNSKMNQAVADRYQLASNTEDQDTLRNAVREKNTRSHLEGLGDPSSAPTSLNEVQELTTRKRHNKILERIHLIPGLKLEMLRSDTEPKRQIYLPIPTVTKQFCVLDMRPDESEYNRSHIWGAVWLPTARLHRATNKMPPDLHYFVKFDESIVIVTGLEGNNAEEAANLLMEYGIAQRNIVLLIQTIAEVEQTARGIIVTA